MADDQPRYHYRRYTVHTRPPEWQAARDLLADSLRRARADDPKMARLLWRRIRKSQIEFNAQFADAVLSTSNVNPGWSSP